ncbi:alkaline phosphatase [Cytobacillus purgationiresistens]|uniref:Alkaline phosphatase n=1 Tax=Cytobacillus purgationiresistens TaxID=863449 RepID=A0ABU0AEX5_9BACI|nr:alkaline phosphatase [Cytobacillus purgationiresistens]MDQ0269404.1 alkaline phosphatase [Cytobacillus purgationiresistens]
MKVKIFYVLITIFCVFLVENSCLSETQALASAEVNGPKNVILMIGDGMGVGQIEIARQLEYGKNGRLFLETLPQTALVHTYSANGIVTDSAAAGTALATGKKTNNGMIGINPNGKEVDSILDLFRKDGKKTGVISTNSVTDATPAAFTASAIDRWANQADIARQQIENGVDVVLGGGQSYFQEDLLAKARKNGYKLVRSKNELVNMKGDRLLGLFAPIHMSFKADRKHIQSSEPSLKLMSKKAIELLNKQDGFFLMIEGARIDHAAHAADIAGVWKETIEFDEAVKYTKNWAEKDKNTLVIVLADHETMGLSGTEPLNIKALKSIKASTEYIVSQFKKDKNGTGYDLTSMHTVMKEYAGIDLTDEELKDVHDRIMSSRGKVYPQNKAAWEIGSLIAEKNHAGIVTSKIRTLSSAGGHTGNPIILMAYGKGEEEFHGVLDNTDIPKKIALLMGYEL